MDARWQTTEDPSAFVTAAGEFLHARPASNSVLLTVSDRLVRGGARAYGGERPLLGWWDGAEGDVAGAFVHTPPYALLLAAPAEAAAALGAQLASAGRELPGVNGEEHAARAFADAFAGSATVHQRHRLHRLGTFTPPDPPPPGRARVATADDGALLEAWMRAFHAEAEPGGGDDVAGAVADRLSYGGWTLWEHPRGTPVAVAGASPPIAGAVRIGPVYTPPEHRRRGYGGGVTAAVTAAALARGAHEVLLFTDLANPTSNALYRRLGYREVEDRVMLVFA